MKDYSSQAVPVLKEGLIWKTEEDGTVIVSVDEGRVRVVNETGTLIWSMIDGQHTLGSMAERLAEVYEELSRSQAEEDVVLFVRSLAERGLILLET